MKELFLVGLSHKSAPIEVREKVALTGDALKAAMQALKGEPGVDEAFVVSTCNRVEVFVHAESEAAARGFFTSRSQAAGDHVYVRRGVEAIRHLFRVSSSLDSMVVGEQQILGQVKEAYGLASAPRTASRAGASSSTGPPAPPATSTRRPTRTRPATSSAWPPAWTPWWWASSRSWGR